MIRYRGDIDGLRAVAILTVILYHAQIPGFGGGFVGVDVFFVISSFLITSILIEEFGRGGFSLAEFYERRARRILPALTLVMLATFLAGAVVLLPEELDALGKSAIATSFFLSNVHFARTLDYFGPTSELVPLLHTWSLAVEEQFYLVFPLLLLSLLRRGGRGMAYGSLLVLTVLSFVMSLAMLDRQTNLVFYQLPFRFWELGIGALLALRAAENPAPLPCSTALSATGLCAILLAALAYDSTTAFPGPAALLPVLGAAAIIEAGRSRAGPVYQLLSSDPAIRIGLISYSLYLWHWPVMALTRSARGTVDLPLWLGVTCILVSVLLASLTYRFVERPFRNARSPGFGASRIWVASLATLGLTASIGAALALGDGAPGRVSDHVRAIAAAARDTSPRRSECFGVLPADGLCVIGAESTTGAADFLLWGDSHALSLLPGFEIAAKRLGLSGVFAGSSACLPVAGLQRVPEDPLCTEFNRAVLRHLMERQDMPLVILAGRWTLAVEGTRFGEETGGRVELRYPEGEPVAARDGNAPVFRQALAQTLVGLRATDRRVLILGPVPEPGLDVPLRVAKSALFFGLPPPLSLDRQSHYDRAGRTERLLDQLAEGDVAVRHVPLSSMLCEESCRLVDSDGIPIYSDDDHLTYSAAERYLATPLSGILAGLLR